MIAKISLALVITMIIESVKSTFLRQSENRVSEIENGNRRVMNKEIKINQMGIVSFDQLKLIQQLKKQQDEEEKIIYIRNIDSEDRETNSTMIDTHSSEIKLVDPITIAVCVIAVTFLISAITKGVAILRKFFRTKETTH